MARTLHDPSADDRIALEAAVAARSGSNKIYDTVGDDVLVGTAGRDHFFIQEGGDDIARGRGGDDAFFFGDTFTSADRVSGGEGNDRIILSGDYSGGVELDPDRLNGIERVQLGNGGNSTYSLLVEDGFSHLSIFAYYSSEIHVDGSSLTTGSLSLSGGGYPDTLIGGTLDDIIYGGGSGDVLTGGGGNDRFRYEFGGDSRLPGHGTPDTITDFSKGDQIWLPSEQIQDAHIGATNNHSGDVVAMFDSGTNRTTLDVYFDSDDVADMTFYLVGDHTDLKITHGNHIVGV